MLICLERNINRMFNARSTITSHSTTDSSFNNVSACVCALVPERMSGLYKDFNPGTVSVENFQSSQHYWEVEVGKKPDWTVGIKMGEEKQTTKADESEILLHLKHNKGYVLSCDGKDTPLRFRDKPQKIGLYLDCERKQVSFYNADNMSRLIQINYSSKQPCCLSVVPGLYLDGINSDPLTVCSYEFNSGRQ